MTELDNSDETRCSASEKSNAQKILQGLCHNTKQTRAIYWDTSGKKNHIVYLEFYDAT